MDRDDADAQSFWQFGELNQHLQQRLVQQNRLKHHVGQVVRGVIPGAGLQHQYYTNPYLQHLYHQPQQARDQGGAHGAGHNDGDENENVNPDTHTHTHGHTHAARRPITDTIYWIIELCSVSFAVIPFIRLRVGHILGLLIFIGLSAVFYYGNLNMVDIVHSTSLWHQYHTNPYLQHLYHQQQARDQGGAHGGQPDLQDVQIDMAFDDVEAQLNEVISHNAGHNDGDENENVNPVTHTDTHGHTHTAWHPMTYTIYWILVLCSASITVIPFMQLMMDLILGLLTFIGLYAVFYYGNLKMVDIVHITSLRDRQAALSCLWLIVFLTANIACTYFIFCDQHPWRVLYFYLPSNCNGDICYLFWVTMVTDNVVKFGCMIIKCTIALMPHVCIRQKQKGKYYMFIEVLVLLYRIALPIIPWVNFLCNNSAYAFPPIVVIGYLVLKGHGLGIQGIQLHKAFQRLKTDTIYGTKPSNEEITLQGENGCPICQDDYQDPIMLSCKHIFCENCVSVWFDREKTCPMCRHEVQTDSPLWRDGSTSAHLQWY